MSRFPECMGAAFMLLLSAGLGAAEPAKPAGYYGYGQSASAQQIAAWDIDVRPDGQGLPSGSGSVADGEMLYEKQCVQCHGSFGEGEGRFPSLAGGDGTLQDARPHKTVGSYWKYTSILWDYIHRAMPYTRPESLTDDEVYAVTAYVLYLNELVEDDFVLTRQNLVDVRLPNEASFVPDPRPDVHNKRCMKNCRDTHSITIKSQAPQYVPEPAAQLAASPVSSTGKSVYSQSCALCHDSGIGGAPVVGNAAEWSDRVAAGASTLYTHAIDGFQGQAGMMPPRGGFAQLSDTEVRQAVDFIMEQSQ